MIKTDRLKLYPASREQMETMIVSERNEELKKAYSEMLEGCLRHPEQWEWYAVWMIEKTDGTHVGDLCFKGLRENGIAEIGYGILAAFQGQGYATEAVQAACRWAWGHAAGSGNGRRERSVAESPRKMRLSAKRDLRRGRAALCPGPSDRGWREIR